MSQGSCVLTTLTAFLGNPGAFCHISQLHPLFIPGNEFVSLPFLSSSFPLPPQLLPPPAKHANLWQNYFPFIIISIHTCNMHMRKGEKKSWGRSLSSVVGKASEVAHFVYLCTFPCSSSQLDMEMVLRFSGSCAFCVFFLSLSPSFSFFLSVSHTHIHTSKEY